MLHGYSDRINHALAFAAKHNDREVRKNMRLPYGTHAANIAIILTAYGQAEDTVVAGILQEVVADFVRDRYTREMLDQRIADKFGASALETALAVSMRLTDDDGVELSPEERRDDFLARIGQASSAARWVCAADAIHSASTILADLKRTIDPDSVWGRYHLGRSGTIRWYRRLYERLLAEGFDAAIMPELAGVVESLERLEQPHSSTSKI
ncbi:MAG TPA: HD domain-containing protein [Gemmatimonadaceae bacterium]|nr:HD domain-containing protein [Gemmatimonadaceae bacterium]